MSGNDMTNCPNCGAPINGDVCEYCGTLFKSLDEVVKLAIGKTVSMSFDYRGQRIEFDLLLENMSLNADCDEITYSDWGVGISGSTRPIATNVSYNVSFGGRMVESEKHGVKCKYFQRELAPDEITEWSYD